MKFNVITGLPRSGSTLLCNVLAQNEEQFVPTSTSSLPALWNSLINAWSKLDETKRDLITAKARTHLRLEQSLIGLTCGWLGYEESEPITVFDKSRAWAANAPILRKVFPESKIICCIRNPVNVFASEIKQHNKQPLLDASGFRVLLQKADASFAKGGVIGSSMMATLDLKHRNIKDVYYLRLEDFSRDPEGQLRAIYQFLGEPYYEGHDFDHVENLSGEVDELWLDKYPHQGAGKIEPVDDLEWKNHMSDDIFHGILANPYVRIFCQEFYSDLIRERKVQPPPAPPESRQKAKRRPKWAVAT